MFNIHAHGTTNLTIAAGPAVAQGRVHFARKPIE